MSDRFSFSESEYLNLLEMGYEIPQSMAGRVSSDGRLTEMQNLALKIYTLSTTALWLYHGTKSPVPRSTKGSFFIDFSSIAILTRAVIETYLTFFEVYVSPEDEDEFEFNYCIWHLAGLIYKENIAPPIGEEIENYKIDLENIRVLSERLKNTLKFQSLSKKNQDELLKGRKRRDKKEIAQKSGISLQFLNVIYGYTSGYTHSDGSTSEQLFFVTGKNEQQEMSQILLVHIMIFMSKFIIDYVKLNPETKTLLKSSSNIYQEAIMWSKVAKLLEWEKPIPSPD